jgi:hypothetical protein
MGCELIRITYEFLKNNPAIYSGLCILFDKERVLGWQNFYVAVRNIFASFSLTGVPSKPKTIFVGRLFYTLVVSEIA